MQDYISPIPLLYILVSIPYTILGLHAWRHRPALAVEPFTWLMVGMAIWSFTYGLEILFPTIEAKLFVRDIKYLGIIAIPVYLIIFALEFTGRRHWLNSGKTFSLLWAIPILILVATWTNDHHNLMWDSARLESAHGLNLLAFSPGPFYWLNIAYAYILVFISTLLLILELVHRPSMYRRQARLMIIGLLVPWAGNIIDQMDISPIRNLDLTPLLFIPTSLALTWAVMRYRLLDILPLEHASVLQNMRDGVIVLDSHQRVLYVNPIAEILLRLSEEQTIGQPLDRVGHGLAPLLAVHLTKNQAQFELTLPNGNFADIYDVTVSPIPLKFGARRFADCNHAIILHDITFRKEAEALLSRREAIMGAIGFAAEQFLKESLWEHAIPAVLERIGRATDVSRVYVAINYTDQEGTVFSSLCYEWAAEGIARRMNDPTLQHVALRQAGFGRWEKLLSTEQSIHGLLRAFPEQEQNFLKEYKVIATAVTPIFAEKQWWGFIGFDECRYEREWTTVELEAIHTTASIFGSAETRTRAEQRLLRRQRILNLLQGIVMKSLQASNIHSMAEELVADLGKLMNANGCFLSLWDEKRQRMIPVAAFGPQKEFYPDLRPEPGEKTLTASALRLRQTLVIENTRNSPHVSSRIASMFSTRSVLVLPMIAGTKPLGVIIIGFDMLHRFQPDEIEISEQATNLIALAIEKFKAVELAHRRADESEMLRKASAAVTQTLHADEAVARILEQLSQVIHFDSASVQLLEGNELVIVGGRGWDDERDVVGMRFSIPGDNPNSKVIQSEAPLILSEAADEYPAFRNPPHNHIRSWLGLPLIAHEKIIGLLAVDSSEPNHFTTDNLALVTTFADQVAIALENARLYKEKQTQAITDALTGVYNRRGLFEAGQFEFARARRVRRPFAAMILDIDHFKEVNDSYGHAAGDQALRTLTERCRHGSRVVDLVGRYGGEEFVLLMPETNLEAARLVAERLRLAIVSEPFPTEAGSVRMTVSIGVAEMKDTDNLSSLINRADIALYESKNRGRNRVAIIK